MNFRSTYTFKRLVPIVGLSIGGIALTYAASVVPKQTPHSTTETHSVSMEQTSSTPVPQVTVNGAPLQLNENGRASVNTPSGATVKVTTDSKTPSVTASISAGNGTNVATNSVTINSGDTAGGSETASVSSSTNVQVFGHNSTSSSSYSHTSVQSNGGGKITITSN